MAHLDPMSATDAAFLDQEDARTHMHVGGVALLDGPVPAWPDVLEHVADRLHLVPRYRQRVLTPPGPLGGPAWTDDPTFRLGYHLRRTALPAPGDAERLGRLISRIFAQRLDRTKPLWELWCVEGLEDGRWALISKAHHALVDDAGGMDLMTVLFEQTDQIPPSPDGPPAWIARPQPSAAQLAASSLGGTARRLSTLPLRALGTSSPRTVLDGLGEWVRAGLSAAPESPLNVRVGPHRSVAFTHASLDDLKAVKDVFGGTVNDVVLACVAGGVRALYHHRGRQVGQCELRACVPVSTSVDANGAPGNRITQLLAPLPIHIADPLERLRVVSAAMRDVKASRRALGAEDLVGMEDFAPPTILARAARAHLHSRLYNVPVTNVPGPQTPLYVLGRRLREVLPVPFLPAERGLAVAAVSYDGRVAFGLLADADAVPDVEVVAEGARAALDELTALATG